MGKHGRLGGVGVAVGQIGRAILLAWEFCGLLATQYMGRVRCVPHCICQRLTGKTLYSPAANLLLPVGVCVWTERSFWGCWGMQMPGRLQDTLCLPLYVMKHSQWLVSVTFTRPPPPNCSSKCSSSVCSSESVRCLVTSSIL